MKDKIIKSFTKIKTTLVNKKEIDLSSDDIKELKHKTPFDEEEIIEWHRCFIVKKNLKQVHSSCISLLKLKFKKGTRSKWFNE
jgi:hypothetical protein